MPKKPVKLKKKKLIKKENRRSKQVNPDLDPKYNLKTRSDLLDQDYLNKLSKKELAYLNKFNKEYVNDSLDRQNLRKNLHRTKRLKKDCDDRNNSRNRDILTRAKASNQLEDFEDLIEQPTDNYEDYLINEIDKKETGDMVTWLSDELDRDENSIINLFNDEEDHELD